ncbi:MAG: hypothetical protein K8T25_04850 [Planctomycetia bacterium]|nr:hypothetical protein [Planctomycetia bacterium]
MSLRAQLMECRESFKAVAAIATCRDSLLFADLCWPPFDSEAELQRAIEKRDPGVIFETASRVVVIEEHNLELRYYAGGWRSHDSRIHLEQDRIHSEGYEMGAFSTVRDAILFAECFLVHNEAVQDIEAARHVRHRRETLSSSRTDFCT